MTPELVGLLTSLAMLAGGTDSLGFGVHGRDCSLTGGPARV